MSLENLEGILQSVLEDFIKVGVRVHYGRVLLPVRAGTAGLKRDMIAVIDLPEDGLWKVVTFKFGRADSDLGAGMKYVEKAVEKYRDILRWHVPPQEAIYMNPKKYDVVRIAKWVHKYADNRVYTAILKAAEVTGYEPVPYELLENNISKYGYKKRRVRVGRVIIYLLKPDEMTKGLMERYRAFKEMMEKFDFENKTSGTRN